MKSTSLSLCSVTVALFSAGALAEPIEPLFETPEYLEHTWVDDVLDVFGADGEFDESETIDMSYLPTAYYTPEKSLVWGF